MYTSFYQLDSKPFEHTAAPEFYWDGEEQQEALAVMQRGMLHNRKFLYLKGEEGTGKTTLIARLTAGLGGDVEWAVIDVPNLDRIKFYNDIIGAFGLEGRINSKVHFLIRFSNFLYQTFEQGRKILLVIDECHHLSQELLEELWLISNIDKDGVRLLNIYFSGQRLFDDLLNKQHNSNVRQRITRNVALHRLGEKGTGDYIRHRMQAAGGDESIFPVRTITAIHEACQGNMNRINVLCDHALSAAAREGKKVVDHQLVEQCAGKLGLIKMSGEDSYDDLFADIGDDEVEASAASEFHPVEEPLRESNTADAVQEKGRLRHVAALFMVCMLVGGGYFWWSAEQAQRSASVDTTASIEAASENRSPATDSAGRAVAEPGKRPVSGALPAASDGSVASGAAGAPSADVRADNLSGEKVKGASDAGNSARIGTVKPPFAASDGMTVIDERPAEPPENEVSPGSVPAQSATAATDIGAAEQQQSAEPGPLHRGDDGDEGSAASAENRGGAVRPADILQEGEMRTVRGESVTSGETYGQNDERAEPNTAPQADMQEEAGRPADTALPPEQSSGTEEVPGDKRHPGPPVIAGQPDETAAQPQPLPDPIKNKKVVLGLQSNSPELTEEGRREFDAFVETLQPYPRATLLVKGYVSAKTNSPENILLSEERARGVQQLLLENGITPERIEIKGMGNQEPLASNDTHEGRRKNRRVEIIVIDDGL